MVDGLIMLSNHGKNDLLCSNNHGCKGYLSVAALVVFSRSSLSLSES